MMKLQGKKKHILFIPILFQKNVILRLKIIIFIIWYWWFTYLYQTKGCCNIPFY